MTFKRWLLPIDWPFACTLGLTVRKRRACVESVPFKHLGTNLRHGSALYFIAVVGRHVVRELLEDSSFQFLTSRLSCKGPSVALSFERQKLPSACLGRLVWLV